MSTAYYNTALWKNLKKIINNDGLHNKWMRIVEYNSPSGASVAVNGVKNGKATVPFCTFGTFAYTARTFGDKSRLYAYLITKDQTGE